MAHGGGGTGTITAVIGATITIIFAAAADMGVAVDLVFSVDRDR